MGEIFCEDKNCVTNESSTLHLRQIRIRELQFVHTKVDKLSTLVDEYYFLDFFLL